MTTPTKASRTRFLILNVLKIALDNAPRGVDREVVLSTATLGMVLSSRLYCMTHCAILLPELCSAVLTAVLHSGLSPAKAGRIMRLAYRAALRTDDFQDPLGRFWAATESALAAAGSGSKRGEPAVNMPGVGRA